MQILDPIGWCREIGTTIFLRYSQLIDENWTEQPDDGFVSLVGPILNRPLGGNSGHFRFFAEKRHQNRAGFVQGGMLMTFADRAMGVTARQNDMDRRHATVQMNVHFLAPVAINQNVDIFCEIVKSTRTLVFMEGRICVGDEIVATAQAIFKVIAAK
jgi:acyl-coenzyme A thioesterase PaaI-like protein